jgi:hypothetical protein
VFLVGEARLEIVRGPVTRLEAMIIAVDDLAHARRSAGSATDGLGLEFTEAS